LKLEDKKNVTDKIEVPKKKEHVVIGNGVTTINLKHPIKFNDVEIKKIDMDFNKLTGSVICAAETQAQARYYNNSTDLEYGQAYQASVAAGISEIPYDAILELKHTDFKVVVSVVKGFLIA
jgi:hypothetical protein